MAKPSLEGMMRQSAAKATPAAPEPAPPPPVAPTKAVDKVTLYLPKRAYRFIKQTALDHDRRPHDLLLEGVDLFLRQHGKSLADFADK